MKGAAFVCGGRYGISINFGLEVVGRKRDCGGTLKSKFIAVNHEVLADYRLTLMPYGPFCNTSSLEPPMVFASGTRKRPPQSGFVQVGVPSL